MPNNTPFVITISRQKGSGGRQIAQALASHFNTAYYDHYILSQAAQETGLGRNIFYRADGRKGFLRQFIGAVQPFIGGGDFYASQLSDENIFSLQSGVIRKLASEHSCVIVGRAADHILADHPRAVRIFITANMEDRTRRVMDEKKVDYKNAVHIIKQTDERRAAYYSFHTSNQWGSADTYDLCINISALGYEASLELLKDFITKKLQLETPATEATETSKEQVVANIPEVF